jgi:hypothetical protein
VNPIYLPEGRKVLKLPLFEIRAATVDRMITSLFFPLSRVAGSAGSPFAAGGGPHRRGCRWVGADSGGSSLGVISGRGDSLGLGFGGGFNGP